MERTTFAVFILALMGFVCGGGYEYPKGGNNFPHPGGQYPRYPVPHPGGQYPPYPVHPGPVYPPTGPNYPPNCDRVCIPEFCMPPFATCPNFPQARCVGVCCEARFFIGGVDVTPFCRGPTIPGRPPKKY
ncbi:annexin A7-like [Magallana gigas]|uniref:annexin A7-like n=1 Tax=Magallana gigas TaxID=29159 RepID=UPI003341F1BD